MNNLKEYILEKLKIDKYVKADKKNLKSLSDDEAMKIVMSYCKDKDTVDRLMFSYYEEWYFSDPKIKDTPKTRKYFEDDYDHIMKVLDQMGISQALHTAMPIKFIKYVAEKISE